jgi:hypothetical protein
MKMRNRNNGLYENMKYGRSGHRSRTDRFLLGVRDMREAYWKFAVSPAEGCAIGAAAGWYMFTTVLVVISFIVGT